MYQRPHDPQRPLVCLDETSKQLIMAFSARRRRHTPSKDTPARTLQSSMASISPPQYLVRLRREGVGPTYSQLSPRKVLNAAADLRAWISDHVVEREMA